MDITYIPMARGFVYLAIVIALTLATDDKIVGIPHDDPLPGCDAGMVVSSVAFPLASVVQVDRFWPSLRPPGRTP
jgi:hypothetical protein